MAKPFDKKFGWVIKDFSLLQSEKCYSVPVLIGDSKWRLIAFPKGNNSDYLSLYLEVYEAEILPCAWRKLVNLRMSIVNQFSQKLSILKETEHCFDGKSTTWGFPAMLSLSKLHENDGGFLVNGEVVIVAELDVFEVIGTLDKSAISEEASELVTKKTENLGAESNDLLKKTSPVKERNNVKQVENSVKCSPTNKRLWIAFLVIFLLIGALYVAHEELLGCKNENFYFREEVIRPGTSHLMKPLYNARRLFIRPFCSTANPLLMCEPVEKRFLWVLKKFSTLKDECYLSELSRPFVFSGWNCCKWKRQRLRPREFLSRSTMLFADLLGVLR